MEMEAPFDRLLRVLIQSGERRRRAGHKINSRIECTIIRKIQTSLEMFKTFYSSSGWQMICFYYNIGCSESKLIFKWRKNNNNKKKPLQGANVRTSCISFSPSQNSHRTRQTNAGDKGCAEACAKRFVALKDQHWRHVVSSLSRGHFRNVFVKSSEMLGFWSFIFL